MDLSTFDDCLDRYGADLARWPADRSGDAAALLARSAPARDLHRALVEIEAILLADRPAAVAPADPIAARAMRHRQQRGLRPIARRAAWAAAAAAALALGLFVGGVSPGHEGSDRVMAAALDSLGPADVD